MTGEGAHLHHFKVEPVKRISRCEWFLRFANLECGGRCGQKTGGERGKGQTLGRVNQQGRGREGLGGFQRCSDRRDTVTGEAGADIEVVLM